MEVKKMSNTFRKEYRELSEVEKKAVEDIKKTAEQLESLYGKQMENKKNPRHLKIAMTNLEQSVMWAVKAVTE
jgi:hypothetical protein